MIKTLWVNNNYRNFNYLIVCEETGEALAVDPLDHKGCLALCQQEGYELTQILNTHEHWDHIGGNQHLIDATGAQVLAHHGAAIPNLSKGLRAGDTIRIGRTIELEVMDTPGHTMTHVCVIAHQNHAPDALFSGDTLFNAGAGNCHNGGHPEDLFATFEQQIHTLADDLQVYPGHDYLENNLRFTLDREPDNATAKTLLAKSHEFDPTDPLVTTIGQERQINTFFRLDSQAIIEKLCAEHEDIGPNADALQVFLKLRELRNSW